MRRFLLVIVLAGFVAPISASASTPLPASRGSAKPWRVFTNKNFGVAFRYPASWKLTAFLSPQGTGQVQVLEQRRNTYSILVSTLPFSPGASIQQTLQRFVTYERTQMHSAIYSRSHWSSVSLGGRPARAAVIRPPTEGGSDLSDAVYIAQWRARVYEILTSATHKPPYSRLSQFPSIYRQILATWQFI